MQDTMMQANSVVFSVFSHVRRGFAMRALAAVSAMLALGILGACSRSSSTQAAGDSASGALPGGSPPIRAARLSALDGDVSLQAAGSNTWAQPSTNYTVTSGDRLATGSNGRAELDLGNAALRLYNGADAVVTNLGDRDTQLGLDQGSLDASVYQYDPADSLEIETPNSDLVPTGPGAYLVSVDPTTNSTLVDVEQGALSLLGAGLSQVLNAGQIVRLVGANPVQIVPVTEPVAAFAPLDRWRAERDRRWVRSGPAAQYVSESIPGWEDLDDNGTWTVDQSNTPAWCPSGVSTSWVPYRQGHWAWVQPWGWTWVDDAPWGYATTHYGRWERLASSSCNDANNWAWVPSPAVAEPAYAPAVVAFVDPNQLAADVAPTVDGWFPLGPTEAYIPPYPHSDQYVQVVNTTNLREVRDIAPLLHTNGAPGGRWANRLDALTVVPAAVLQAGEPVARHVVAVAPNRIATPRVVWQPSVRPAPQLVAGGPRMAPPPHVPVVPRAFVTRGNPHAGAQNLQREQRASGELALPPSRPVSPSTYAAPPAARPFGQPAIRQPRGQGMRAAPVPVAPAPSARPRMVVPPRAIVQPRMVVPPRAVIQPRAPVVHAAPPPRQPAPAAPAGQGGRGGGRGGGRAGGPPAGKPGGRGRGPGGA